MAQPPSPPPPKLSALQLVQAVSSLPLIQALHVAAKLELPDRVKARPRDAEGLGQELGIHPQSLGRLLELLAALGVFTRSPEGVFGPTMASSMLEKHRAGTAFDMAAVVGAPFHWNAWGALEHAVRTGESAFISVHGLNLYDYLDAHPAEGEVFFRAHSQAAKVLDQALLKIYDFSAFTIVLDIGGGDGTFVAQLLASRPHLRAVLFDLPQVLQSAAPLRDNPALLARCELTPGNFFESIPPGADLYVLRGVAMDWDDVHLLKLLRNCEAALVQPGAKLVMALTLLGPSEQTRMLDLTLLVLSPSGRLRTEAELRELHRQAGLEVIRVVRAPFGDGCALESRRAPL